MRLDYDRYIVVPWVKDERGGGRRTYLSEGKSMNSACYRKVREGWMDGGSEGEKEGWKEGGRKKRKNAQTTGRFEEKWLSARGGKNQILCIIVGGRAGAQNPPLFSRSTKERYHTVALPLHYFLMA
jgi:hypothetical protein